MTVLEVIQRSTEFLTRKSVDSPRLQAELLLAHVLKLPRMRLYLSFDRVLNETETAAMRGLVLRRASREPLQQIVGSTSFCGLEILVNRDVLVPRPETELLAERGWTFLNALTAGDPTASPTVLDYGTGSGCLAAALASHCPSARIHAMEASAAALEVARRNVATLGVADRIRFIEGSDLGGLDSDAQYDLLISNPPYIPSAEILQLQPEVRDFEPRQALDGGPDGLDFYRQLAARSGLLSPRGRLMVEFGDGQAEAIRCLLEEQKWIVEAVEPDYTGRLRLLTARRS